MWPRSESLRDAAVSTANWLWLIAAGAAIVGAAYLLGQLSALRDSTRFASDLAEIRTFAMRVALVSETVRGGDSREYLEHELELAHQQSESLTAGILDILGAEVGEQQMRAVVASWDAVAEASRGHADGSVDAASLLAAAERATADVTR